MAVRLCCVCTDRMLGVVLRAARTSAVVQQSEILLCSAGQSERCPRSKFMQAGSDPEIEPVDGAPFHDVELPELVRVQHMVSMGGAASLVVAGITHNRLYHE